MGGTTSPTVSLIVPTYNRGHLLRTTLQSFAELRIPPGIDVEMLICDDGSSDETLSVIRDMDERLPDVRYCWQPDRDYRVSASLNMGVRLARGQILLVLDSGVLVAPDLVMRHLDRHLAAGADGADLVVLGQLCGYLADEAVVERAARRSDPPWWSAPELRSTLSDPRQAVFDWVDDQVDELVAPWCLLLGSHFSLPVATMRRVGGYDEDFTGWGYEDYELGYRLHAGGVRFRVARDALALHLPHPPALRSSVEPNRRLFFEKHPGLMTELLASFRARPYNRHVPAVLDTITRDLVPDYRAVCPLGWADALRGRCGGRTHVNGCGTGELLELLEASSGCEPDARKAERARRLCPVVELSCGLGVQLPLEDRAVESVVVSDFWRAFPEAVVAPMLREARRVANRVLLLYTPGFAVPGGNDVEEWTPASLRRLGWSPQAVMNESACQVYELLIDE